jgi:hypothetical protein
VRATCHNSDVGPKVSGARTAAVWAAAGAVAAAILVLIALSPGLGREKSLAGAVLVADADPRKQSPIPDVEVTADIAGVATRANSDAAGFFRLSGRGRRTWRGEQVTLRFRHPGYEPLAITQPLSGELCIARMQPTARAQSQATRASEISVADIRVRYAVKATTTINAGSTARTFEVVNAGNVPCDGRAPCSPDGKWKAADGSLALDAAEGQEFRNARVSCIAGPCPFTSIVSDGFSRGGRNIGVKVRGWSDTVTFLVEAEVVHTMLSDVIRQAYPSVFGRALTFTLPPTGQGPSIEAEVNGLEIVFPLGPDLSLSWASCTLQAAPDGTRLYRCGLKPGYRFK